MRKNIFKTIMSFSIVIAMLIPNITTAAADTNYMLRILSKDKSLIKLYTDSSLTNEFTYISQDYVEDAPIIEDNGRAAKIQISGFTGWIDKNTSSEVVQISEVKNPSYYISKGGILKHFISYDMKSTTNRGYELILGPAPSYLKDDVKYFSYDGNYFYEGSDLSTGLNKVVTDLKNGNHNNSINAANPHYLYFNYLPFRSATGYSAAELNRFIDNNTDGSSKLRGIGQALINAQNTYGVNAVLTLSVAINESAWGMSAISKAKNNLFGIKAFDSNPGESADTFNSPGDSVIEFAKNYISRGYADPADWRYQGGFLGNKNRGANVKYASDPFWGEKAAQFAHKIDSYLNSSDQNAYQLGMYRSNNEAKNGGGTLLYNISSNVSGATGRSDTSMILTTTDAVSKNGVDCYEIYPERNTPVNNGGSQNKFSGNYDWNDKGYVKTSGISFINTSKNIVLPYEPKYVNQWHETSSKKWYYYDGNSKLSKGWLKLNGTYYFLDKSTGEMKTGWIKDNNDWYYLNTNGSMAIGKIETNGKVYHLDGSGAMRANGWISTSSGWYYLSGDGYSAIGWRLINGTWYYFASNGVMATGKVEVAGKFYHLDGSGGMRSNGWISTSTGWYYLEGDGSSAIGWKQLNGKWYYLTSNGSMAVDWIDVNGTWYYSNRNGEMQTGWINTSSGWYYLEGSGAMSTGWRYVNSKWYYLRENTGAMAIGIAEINKDKYFLDGSGAMITGWKEVDGKWYYFKNDGAGTKSNWVKTNYSYYMNADSVMVTGWQTIDGKKYYFYPQNGSMARNVTIDGILLNNDGIAVG